MLQTDGRTDGRTFHPLLLHNGEISNVHKTIVIMSCLNMFFCVKNRKRYKTVQRRVFISKDNCGNRDVNTEWACCLKSVYNANQATVEL